MTDEPKPPLDLSQFEKPPVENWPWWVSRAEDGVHSGPYGSREEAVEEVDADDGGLVCQAISLPLRLSQWVNVNAMLEHADESLFDNSVADPEYDEGPIFDANLAQAADLILRIKTVIDQWQADHGLRFIVNTFSHSTRHEWVPPVEAEPVEEEPTP